MKLLADGKGEDETKKVHEFPSSVTLKRYMFVHLIGALFGLLYFWIPIPLVAMLLWYFLRDPIIFQIIGMILFFITSFVIIALPIVSISSRDKMTYWNKIRITPREIVILYMPATHRPIIKNRIPIQSIEKITTPLPSEVPWSPWKNMMNHDRWVLVHDRDQGQLFNPFTDPSGIMKISLTEMVEVNSILSHRVKRVGKHAWRPALEDFQYETNVVYLDVHKDHQNEFIKLLGSLINM